MYHDIMELNHFYQTPLGERAADAIWSQLRYLIPHTKGQKIVGLGYASPYLSCLEEKGIQLINFMPAQQGVTWWPSQTLNRTALVDEADLPLDDQSVDCVILVHSLDSTEQLPRLLREVWRVLVGQGKLIVIVPNRRGFWARSDRTPFGYGRAFSNVQLRSILAREHFVPNRPKRSLFFPPFRSTTFLKLAKLIDDMGRRFFPGLSGVYIMDAVKQVYSMRVEPVTVKKAIAVKAVPVVSMMDNTKRDF